MKLNASLALLALALVPLAAPLLAGTHPLAALCIRAFFSRVCHQDPARSLLLFGSPAAVCVRCLGIYLGVPLAGLLGRANMTATRWLPLALVFNLVDVATGALHLHGNMAWSRFLLGLFLGWATGLLFFAQQRHGREA